MNEAITLDIRGIKCDNKSCDYSDMEAVFDPEKYLNMPCPECGESLFTPEDYRIMKALLGAFKATNDVFKGVDLSAHDMLQVPVEMDGTGRLSIGRITHVSSESKG